MIGIQICPDTEVHLKFLFLFLMSDSGAGH